MKRYWFPILLVSFVLSATNLLAQQRGRREDASVTHTLIGDFKVENKSQGTLPTTFQVVLTTVTGRQVGRLSVNPNGRYSFNNVENGEYNLAIEVDGTEALRMTVRVDAIFKTDVRRDLLLEWRGTPTPGTTTSPGAIPAAEIYTRSEVNQKLFEKGEDSVKKKDLKQAVSLFNQIVTADAKDFPAWTELGTVYFKQEKMGDAEKAFRNALNAKPDFLLAQMNLGKLQFTQKNYEAAIETFTKAIEANPQSAEANMFLGESYLQIKKGSKAVGHFYKAIELDPVGMAEAHLRLGTLYRGAGMKDKAVVEFEQFLQKKPDYPDKQKLQQYISENK